MRHVCSPATGSRFRARVSEPRGLPHIAKQSDSLRVRAGHFQRRFCIITHFRRVSSSFIEFYRALSSFIDFHRHVANSDKKRGENERFGKPLRLVATRNVPANKGIWLRPASPSFSQKYHVSPSFIHFHRDLFIFHHLSSSFIKFHHPSCVDAFNNHGSSRRHIVPLCQRIPVPIVALISRRRLLVERSKHVNDRYIRVQCCESHGQGAFPCTAAPVNSNQQSPMPSRKATQL